MAVQIGRGPLRTLKDVSPGYQQGGQRMPSFQARRADGLGRDGDDLHATHRTTTLSSAMRMKRRGATMQSLKHAVARLWYGPRSPKFAPRPRISMPPSDLDGFWRIVEETVGGTQSTQFAAHTERLRRMTREELMVFYCDYHRMHAQAGTWELWGAAYVINGGCSDDGFHYFRDWLISRGRRAYEDAMQNPETLADIVEGLPEGEGASFEMYGYVPTRVYKKDNDFGSVPIIDWSPISREIRGEPFIEATVAQRYPALARVARD